MSNEKFTPGEWLVESFYYETGKRTVYEIVYNEDGDRVAESIDKKEDAILMSASKEMYEALVALVGKCRPGWQEVNVSKETIEKALKALKKARGEE